MIKLNAMRYSLSVFLISSLMLGTGFFHVSAQTQPAQPVVISPRSGEAVQGRIEITGITAADGFIRAEVDFRYVNDPKDTWFPIAENDQASNPGKICEWDTSVITDGNYDLRLTVCLVDGTCQSTTIPGIRVRNYSPVETATPQSVDATPDRMISQETAVPTRTLRPTQLPLKPNPAVLTQSDVNASLIRGLITGIGFFIAFGIYWIVKRSLS